MVAAALALTEFLDILDDQDRRDWYGARGHAVTSVAAAGAEVGEREGVDTFTGPAPRCSYSPELVVGWSTGALRTRRRLTGGTSSTGTARFMNLSKSGTVKAA